MTSIQITVSEDKIMAAFALANIINKTTATLASIELCDPVINGNIAFGFFAFDHKGKGLGFADYRTLIDEIEYSLFSVNESEADTGNVYINLIQDD